MKTRLILFCLFISTMNALPQNAVISGVAQKLNDYYQFYPPEKIQLITDKEVYKPEEIVWFSMLITNSVGQQIKPASTHVVVNLFSDNGVQITNDIFQANSGFSKGDLMLPKGLKEGKYVLVARTQLMSNANEAFYKLLYIDPKNEDAIRLKEKSAPSYLTPGKIDSFSFHIENMEGEPMKGEKLTYELYDKNDLILDDKIKTESDGSATIDLTIPGKKYDQPLKLVIADKKGELNYTKLFPVKNEKVRIRFYPEGGHLQANAPQKIGFTAHDELGNPLTIAGEVVNQAGKLVTQVHTIVPGYGMLPVMLQKDDKYTLRITSDLGENEQFDLPAIDNGFSLGIASVDKDFIYTNIIPSKKDSQTVYLLAGKGANIFWASEASISGPSRIKIPKADFPNGVSMLAAFNNDGKELASRLVYVDKHQGINIEVSAPERVSANQVFKFAVTTKNIIADHPVRLDMSISAAQENKDWPEQWDSWLLINSDLQNEITNAEDLLESPNFESTMNYLLIANRFKNFDWSAVLDFNLEQEQNKVQGSGVFGKVLDQKGQLIPHAKVSLVNSQNMQILSASADEKGAFYIASVDPSDLTNFAVKAIDPEGNENLKVQFNKSIGAQLQDQVISFLNKQEQRDQRQYSSDFFNSNMQLFSKIKIQHTQEEREPPYRKYLESGNSILDAIKIIKPYQLDGDKIIFPGGKNSLLFQDGALIVIDGQKMGTSASVLNSINPQDVETINISTNPIDIQRYTGLNSVGLIEIETKRGEFAEEPAQRTSESLYANGVRVPRDFWVKKSGSKSVQPTTLFWNPSASINANGRWEYEVTTNDVIGQFKIQVNAIDEQGRISKVTKTFEVVPK
ncbi:MAG TPA: MG2 domain-containing protein [Sunxiuqinia sp.]|nr:MG2 domain-containing protein [Sunxiuqinia sp.]